MTLGEVTDFLPGSFMPVTAFLFGLLWGSFLNVVIYRVPLEMSVVRPGSHCPGCGKPIAGYDNVPVLSYLILRGRARCCGARMSPRYPLVELIGGALSLAILEAVVLVMARSTPFGVAAGIYAADFALALGLVAAAFIDAEHMFLPDSITIGGGVLGLATAGLRAGNVASFASYQTSLAGALVGFLVVWFPFTFLYKGLLGRTGMGMGDAKLVALAGAWFGWEGALFALFAGAFQGSIYALVLRVLGIKPALPAAVVADLEALRRAAAEGDEEARKELEGDPLAEDDDAFLVSWFLYKVLKRPRPAPEPPSADDHATEDEEPRARIPFGPFLILACLELLLAHDWIASHLSLSSIYSLD